MSGKGGKPSKFSLNSKFWRTFLTIFAMLLIFAGPTYFVLFLWKGLDFNYAVSMISGFSLFIIGLILLIFLIQKRVVS
jgi:hypothetical protein